MTRANVHQVRTIPANPPAIRHLFKRNSYAPTSAFAACLSCCSGRLLANRLSCRQTVPPHRRLLPNARWSPNHFRPTARGCATTRAAFATDDYYQELTVAPTTGGDERTLLAQWSPLGLGYTLPAVRRWSEDGETLYFTQQPVVDGCALFAWSEGLYSVRVRTGSPQRLLVTRSVPMAVAPDENGVAWIDRPNAQLVVHDLAAGSVITYPLSLETGKTDAGNLVWDPTSTQVAFGVAHDPCSGAFAASTSIMLLDVAGGQMQTLLDEDARLLLPVSWDDPTVITVTDRAGTSYLLDPASGEITPTP